MNTNKLILAAITTAVAGMAASAAQASYFVRPYAQVGGTVSDGLDVNGATSGSSNVGSEASVSIDLDAGEVHSYLLREQGLPGGTEFAQAAGIFGDRVTFNGGTGTDVEFSFSFDGTIAGSAKSGSETLLFGAYASLYVFDASAGADYTNFSSQPGALIKLNWSSVYSDPTEDVYEWIDDVLSGSVTLTGSGTYDIFAFLNLSAVMNDNGGYVEMDFSNTGTFGISTAPGVTYSSDSGVFLDSVPPAAVPEPSSWAMMIGGFAMLGFMMRTRRTMRFSFA